MVESAKKTDFVSLADYLAREEKADYKSEYFAGQIYMMAGGSPNHNRISGNVFAALCHAHAVLDVSRLTAINA